MALSSVIALFFYRRASDGMETSLDVTVTSLRGMETSLVVLNTPTFGSTSCDYDASLRNNGSPSVMTSHCSDYVIRAAGTDRCRSIDGTAGTGRCRSIDKTVGAKSPYWELPLHVSLSNNTETLASDA